MTTPRGYTPLLQPLSAQAELAALVEVLTAAIGRNLVGIYASDASASPSTILLVVIERPLRRDTRFAMLQTLLRHSSPSAPVTAFVVRRGDLAAPEPPTPLELLFDESRRDQLVRSVQGTAWLKWPELPTKIADLTTIIERLRRAGRTLAGAPFASLIRADAAAPPAPATTTTHPPAPSTHGDQQLTLEEK